VFSTEDAVNLQKIAGCGGEGKALDPRCEILPLSKSGKEDRLFAAGRIGGKIGFVL
jgi:hypothetical protein